MKKALSVVLVAELIALPLAQAVAAPLHEAPPQGAARVPAVAAPISGHMAPQDASAATIGATLPQSEIDGAATSPRESLERAPASAQPAGTQAETAPASDAKGPQDGDAKPSEASAAAGSAVADAYAEAERIIGKARSKKLLKRAGSGSALAREAQEMHKSAKKAEALLPEFYRGRVPLNYLSKLETNLTGEAQERVLALRVLLHMALRSDRDNTPEDWKVLTTGLTKGLVEELGLRYEDIEKRVLDAHKIDTDNDIPPAVWERVGKLGLMRLKVPKEYGGMGLHQREYAEVMKSLAYVSGSLLASLSAQNTIATAPLVEFGTEAQKAKILPKVAQSKFVSSFGLTEPGAGTDLNKMGMTAVLSADRKSWRLTGEKIFITGVDDAGMLYLVTGHTIVDGVDLGPSVLMVDLPFVTDESWDQKVAKMKALDKKGLRLMSMTRDSGFELMMIHGSDQAYIQMKDFEVPVVAADGVPTMLGLPGEGKIVPLVSLNRGRAGFGPMMAEAATYFVQRQSEWAADRKMFDMYAEKGKEGIQGGMEYPQAKLGSGGIKAAVLRAVSDLTSALVDANPGKSVAALSAAIKARVSEWNWDLAQNSLEGHGGHGLFKGAPNGVERDFRDAWIALIVEGVNPAMKQLVHLMGGMGVQKEMMQPWRHPLAVPAFLLRQLFSRLRLTADTGGLNYADAAWIQSRAARFALRFGVSAVALQAAHLLSPLVSKLPRPGPLVRRRWHVRAYDHFLDLFTRPFEKRQNTLIAAYEVFMDLFTLSAVELKLAKNERLSDEEKAQLLGAVPVLRERIDANMKSISVLENATQKIERQVGAAMIEAQKAKQGERANRVETQMKWLKDTTDAFYGSEFEGNVESPSGIDGKAELEKAGRPPRFRAPQPKAWMRRLTRPLAKLALKKRFRIVEQDFPEADRRRLVDAVNPQTAFFFGPNHPEFGTDWIIDKTLVDYYAPQTMHWAAADLFKNPYVAKFLAMNNVMPNDGGEAGKELSIQSALASRGTLLHPEGTVWWKGDKITEMFPGIFDMATEAAKRAGPGGKPVFVVNPVWKSEYLGDVSAGLRGDMAFIETKLGLPSGDGLAVSERFGRLQSGVLDRQTARYAADLGPIDGSLDFFARQEHVRGYLLGKLQASYRVEPSSSLDKMTHRLIKEIRARRRAAVTAKDQALADRLTRDLETAEEAKRLGKFDRAAYGGAKLTQEQIGESLKRLIADLVEPEPVEGGLLRRFAAKRRNMALALEKLAPKPYGPRKLHIRIQEPIRVLADGKETSAQYLARMRAGMQKTLDEINAEIAPSVARFAQDNPFYGAAPSMAVAASAIAREAVLRQHIVSGIAVSFPDGARTASLPTPRQGAPDSERAAQVRGDNAMLLLRGMLAFPDSVERDQKELAAAFGRGSAARLLAAARALEAQAKTSPALAAELAAIRAAWQKGVNDAEAFLAELDAQR